MRIFFVLADCVQEFEQRPVNTSVTEGQNVMLQCSVRDLAGMLQWSKGGIMLGNSQSSAVHGCIFKYSVCLIYY